MLRPKNSVFSIFCPNAMQLQVDVTKKIPTGNPSGKGKDSGRCRCGYRWPVVGGMVKRSESPSGRSDPANHGSAVTSDGNRSIDPHMSNLSLASTTTSASRATNSHHTLAKDDTIVLLKEGFRLTPRFLAKSHCDASALRPGAMIDDPSAVKGGYGCVLCTSLGRAETFDDVEGLRVHINACHDKWQMLHDRDLK